MKIRLTPNTANELDELLAYIESDNPQAATIVADRIERSFDFLAEYPYIGRPSA